MQVSKLLIINQTKHQWESKGEASFFYLLICSPNCQGPDDPREPVLCTHSATHPPHVSILNKSAKGFLQQMQTFARKIWEQNAQKKEMKVCNRSKGIAPPPTFKRHFLKDLLGN